MHPPPRIIRVDDRDLAVEDPAPGHGFPVIVHNGAGSRHLFPPAVTEGRERGLRLIGYDRPGCGDSAALPGRVIADCAADVRAIMADLGLSRVAAWGSSGGGPYALATAATLPDAVAAVCVFASIGPYDQPDLDFADGLGGRELRAEVARLSAEPERARADFRAQSAMTLAERGSAQWWLAHWGDRAEQDAAHSRDWADYLALCHRDVLRADDHGGFDDDGSWEDNLAVYRPWGFDLAAITAPVSLWHGLADFVPVAHALWIAAHLRNVSTHLAADEDHTNVEENNRAAALDWLAAQIG